MRVALFTGNYNYTRDGANQALNRLVGYLLREAGAQVRVYSPTSPTPAFAPTGTLISAPSIRVPFRREYRFGLGLTPKLKRDILRFRPDVVHVSSPDLLDFRAQALARRLDVPVIASVHTRFETYFEYYGLGFLRPAAERLLERFYAGCDYVLAPTPFIAAEMSRGPLNGRVKVWGRGVDREAFSPRWRSDDWRAAHGIEPDDVVLLFFGRTVMEKGLALFAEVAQRALRQDRRVKVLVVGDGPARPWLAQQLPTAIFTGHLGGEGLSRAVASADIFLNPSLSEAFGNVTLEAMAAGLPTVGADVSNHRNLLRQGVTGLMCDPKDAAAYGAAILGLLTDPARRRAMGAKAREASAAFSWSAACGVVVDIYREAMEAHGQPVVRPVRRPAVATPVLVDAG